MKVRSARDQPALGGTEPSHWYTNPDGVENRTVSSDVTSDRYQLDQV